MSFHLWPLPVLSCVSRTSPGRMVNVAPDFVWNSSVPDRVMTKRGTGSWCHSYDPPDCVSWKDSSTTGTGSPIEAPPVPFEKSIQPSSNSESPSSPVHMRTQRIIAGFLPTAEMACHELTPTSEQTGPASVDAVSP